MFVYQYFRLKISEWMNARFASDLPCNRTRRSFAAASPSLFSGTGISAATG
jgi:hypothetical protein